MNQITEVNDTFRTAPIRECIYCGATNDLTDEHVVPYALAGRLVLPQSSCRKCAAITSAFERRVLRGFMLDARTAGGYPTRRERNRPHTLPLEVERNGVVEQVNLKPDQHPAFLHLPILVAPAILGGRSFGVGVTIEGHETSYFGQNPEHVAKQLGVKTIQDKVNWDINAFSRMLAKIGYSYAVSARGALPRECVPVLPLILGTSDDASNWLGSARFQLQVEAKQPLHALGTEWIRDPSDSLNMLLVARVKLFARSGVTGYKVVVCRVSESSLYWQNLNIREPSS